MKDLPITYLKAFGIILMVTAHAHAPKILCDAICLFHMPLFFIASGYCLKPKYILTPFLFAKRRMITIWWPYVKWMTIFTLLHNFFFSINILSDKYGVTGTSYNHIYSVNEIQNRLGEVLLLLSHEDLLSGYWFLKSLFWGTVFLYFFLWSGHKIIKSRKIITYTTGIVLLCINLTIQYFDRELSIFHISPRDFHATFFLWFGYYWNQEGFRTIKSPILLFVTSITFGLLFWRESMLSMDTFVWIPYTITACICTLSLFTIFEFFCKRGYICQNSKSVFRKLIEFIGNNTLVILTWHFLSFKVISYALVYIYNLPPSQTAEWPVIHTFAEDKNYWIFYLLSGLAIPLILAYINKYIPNKFCKL